MAHERARDGDFRRRAARIFFKSVNGRLRKTRPSLGKEFLGKENVRAAREGGLRGSVWVVPLLPGGVDLGVFW